MRRSGAEGPQRGRYTCGTTGTNMAREEDLMKQVEELKRKLREAEEEKEEIWRRRKEARGGEYTMRESDAGGIASRAMGSAVHMGQLGIDNNNNYRRFYFLNKQQQSQMVVADVIFFSGAAGPVGRAMGSAMHVGLQGQEDYHGGPLSEVSGSPEWLQTNNVEMPMFSLSEVPSAAPATGGTVFPTASVGGTARAPASDDGTMALTAASATGGTVPSAASVGGAPASSAVVAASMALTAASATGGTVPSAASVEGAPASSAVVAASVESAAEPAISGTVPSAASVKGEVGGRESPAGTASSDAVAEAAPLTGDTVISDASVERADEQLTLDESSAGTASSDAVAKAAALTGDTASPDASVERVAGKLTLNAGSSSEICGERGASTHPFDPGIMFPLEVRYASSSSSSTSNSNSSSSSSSSSSHKDVAYAGALLRPFDPGKRCHRGARIEKAVRGLDLPFDRGKTWRRMQHGG